MYLFFFKIFCQCLLAQASLDSPRDSDSACFSFPRIPTFCQRHPVQSVPVFTHSSKLGLVNTVSSCGETVIRTPETLLEFTRFPGVPLQPLEHLSLRIMSNSATKVLQIIDIRKFFGKYFLFSHILWLLFAYIKKIYYLCPPIKNNHLYVYHRHCGRYRLG